MPTPSMWGVKSPLVGDFEAEGQGGHMSMGLDQIGSRIATHLEQMGMCAVTSWDGGNRLERDCPVVAVSLRGCQSKNGSFANYLGEQLNSDTGGWEEIYGRRVTLTMGLDLYATVAVGECAIVQAFDQMVEGLTTNGLDGMNLVTISCGETVYDEGERLLKRTVEGEWDIYLYAVCAEGDSFLDFRVKGGLLE